MKQLVFILFTFCVISNSYAQMDCESIPSCEELGYTQESCSGGKGVRCPFDETKFYCAGAKQLPDAPDPVITLEDWTAECADKINYCTAYNNDCQCTACESGYLLSDGACVPECDKSVDICAAESKEFNAETCTCEACREGWKFNSETKDCRLVCGGTITVEHCVVYGSIGIDYCECEVCEDGYELSNGVCVPECDKSVDICAAESKTFNSANCTCEDCSSGYLFDNEVNECREACKKEWQCAEHDSLYNPCSCTKCSMGAYLTNNGSTNYSAFMCNLVAETDCKVDYCIACDLTGSVCVACGNNRILKDNKCVLRENKCSHGTIIYDDFQCYKEDQVPSGRVPIGIVINSTNDLRKPGKLKILSLDAVDLPWSENLASTKTGCNSRTDGKANTDCIIAAGAEENSAAVYCNNYGVMHDDQGQWFLPSIQEVLILGTTYPDYFYQVEENGRFFNTALKAALDSLGNSTNSSIDVYDGLLSSTEYSDTQAIYSNHLSSLNLSWDSSSTHQKVSKTKKKSVRCVREFEDAPTIEHCYNYTRHGCLYCDDGYMVSEDRASCIQASCSEIEDCQKYDPTTCRCTLCSPQTGSYLSSDGFACFRPIPYCKDQKDNVCEACKSGYVLSDDKLSCISQ